MLATDPVVTFLLVLVIGIIAGILFDRLAGPSWLARQFSGSNSRHHHECTSRRCRRLRRLSHRCAACVGRRAGDVGHCSGGRRRCGAVRLADGQVNWARPRLALAWPWQPKHAPCGRTIEFHNRRSASGARAEDTEAASLTLAALDILFRPIDQIRPMRSRTTRIIRMMPMTPMPP